jgi:putative ABC transport system substrate-binding protein
MSMARKVGFFHNGTKGSFQKHFAAFVGRMYDFVEDEDVKIVERWAGDDTSKSVDQHLNDLVGENVAVLVAAGGPPSALAAKKATDGKSTPVVFTSVADPVRLGLVTSLESPGGNMTGIAGLTSELDVARLQLLRELLGSGPAKIGVLNNSKRPQLKDQYAVLEAAASGMNVTLVRKDVGDLGQIEAAFTNFKSAERIDALLVTADSLFNDLRQKVVKLAGGMPAIYQWREFAEAGGYMSFGPNILDAYEMVAEYVGYILDGEKPADLPVTLPTRFELVINIDVAYAAGFKIPASLLSRAEFVERRLRTRRSAALRSAG